MTEADWRIERGSVLSEQERQAKDISAMKTDIREIRDYAIGIRTGIRVLCCLAGAATVVASLCAAFLAL